MKELSIIEILDNHIKNFDKISAQIAQEQKETLEILNSINTKNKDILLKTKEFKNKIKDIKIDKVLKNRLLYGFSVLTYIWNEETNNIEIVKIKNHKNKDITIVGTKNYIVQNKMYEIKQLWKNLKIYNINKLNLFCNKDKTFVFIKTNISNINDIEAKLIELGWQIEPMTYYYKGKTQILNTIIKEKFFVHL